MPEMNFEGKVEAIHILPVEAGPISQIEQVKARESGLEGDRERKAAGRAATLVSAEVLEDIKKEAPFAYKDIGPVVDTLKEAEIATPVAELRPIMTIKG